MKKLRITIEGKSYEVEVEEIGGAKHPAPQPPSAFAPVELAHAAALPHVEAPVSGRSGDVPCPLGGMVISVVAQLNQEVRQGDVLVIVEAMKMNTQIFAPTDGKVTEILVKSGDAVTEGQTLVRIT